MVKRRTFFETRNVIDHTWLLLSISPSTKTQEISLARITVTGMCRLQESCGSRDGPRTSYSVRRAHETCLIRCSTSVGLHETCLKRSCVRRESKYVLRCSTGHLESWKDKPKQAVLVYRRSLGFYRIFPPSGINVSDSMFPLLTISHKIPPR